MTISLLPVVEDIVKVVRTEDKEKWFFKGSLKLLRELREAVQSESRVRKELEEYEEDFNNGK